MSADASAPKPDDASDNRNARSDAAPATGPIRAVTGAIRTVTGAIRLPGSETGAIRTIGANPATAPIVLHPGDAISGRRRFLYVLLLGALTALGPFTVDTYLPAFGRIQSEFHTTESAVQLTLTGTMLGFGLGQLIVGPLSDRLGRRIPLIVVTAVHIAASLMAAASPTLAMLGTARVLQGIGAAAGGVVAMAMVRDLFGGKRLVVMLSRLALVTGVAPVIAPLIGSWLLQGLGMSWHGVFVCLASYGLVMLVCALLFLPETLPKARRAADQTKLLQRYRSVLGDRVFLGVLAIGGMTFSGLFSYLSASSFLFQEQYHFTTMQYGLVFAANSVGLIIGNQTASRLAARYGPQWVLAFSTVLLLLAGSAIVVTDMFDAGPIGTIVPLFFFLLGAGFTFPCVQVLALDRNGSAAGTAASLLGMCNNVIAALISPLPALLFPDAGITPTTMACVMVACSAVSIIVLWTVIRPKSVGMLTP